MLRREDMLELTRRMNTSRTCFSRIAGAYLDSEGFIDGTFNTSFLKLSNKEMMEKLEVAKTVPFAKTNENLTQHKFNGKGNTREIKQLLNGLRDCGLKNDAMMEVLYELIAQNYKSLGDYCIFMYFGRYDIPVKASDNVWLDGSEEVYEYLICTVSPLLNEYTPGKPVFGFLYPSFAFRSTDFDNIAVYNVDKHHPHKDIMENVLGLNV